MKKTIHPLSFYLRVSAAPSAPLARHLPVSSSDPYLIPFSARLPRDLPRGPSWFSGSIIITAPPPCQRNFFPRERQILPLSSPPPDRTAPPSACMFRRGRWFLSRHGSRSSRSMLSWTIFKVCSLYGSSPLSN